MDLSSWETPCLTDCRGMFTLNSTAPITEIDLSSFSTDKLQNCSDMFYQNSKLADIYMNPEADFSKITIYDNKKNMFRWDYQLPHFDENIVDNTRAVIDNGTNNGYFKRKAKLTLDPNGARGEKIYSFHYLNSTYTLPENMFAPIRNAQQFLGWSTTKSEEDIITDPTITIADDMTLYAIWTEN